MANFSWDNFKPIDYTALSKLTAEDIADAKQSLENANTSSSNQGSSGGGSSNPPPASNPTPAVSNSQSNSNTGNSAMASTNYNHAKKVSGGYEVLVPDSDNLAFGSYSTKFIPDDQVTVNNTRNTPIGHGMVSTTFDISVNDTPKADSGAGTGNMYIDPDGEYGKAIIGASEISYPGTAETERLQGLISSESNNSSTNQSTDNNNNKDLARDANSSGSGLNLEGYVTQADFDDLLNRYNALEEQVAGTNVQTSTGTARRNVSGGGTSTRGLINDIISKDSPLSDSSKLKVGGQVYGPDGSVYPSITDAIMAGVSNFSYFPISTGIRQPTENPITRRSFGSVTPTVAQSNPVQDVLSG